MDYLTIEAAIGSQTGGYLLSELGQVLTAQNGNQLLDSY